VSVRRWFAILAAAVVTAVGARPARAGCGVPPAFAYAPEDGATLPPNPTVWVFLRDRFGRPRAPIDELTITDGRGLPLRAVRTDVPTEGMHRAVRLQISSAEGTVTIRARAGKEETSARYRLRHALRTEDMPPATEIVAAKYVYASGCPSANGFLLSITPKAPAYRVELDGHTWIVPDQPAAYGSPAQGTIITGGVYCYDFTIPTNKPLALEVTPLHADGRVADTRYPGCIHTGPPAGCVSLGGGRKRCTTGGMTCGSWSWELTGAVKAEP
jgi:hypothetical protein